MEKVARVFGVGMTKILLVGVGIVGVALMAIVPANAADLWVPPVYTVPVRVFSWTGCYVGGNIGWGRGRETVSLPDLGETTGVPALAGVSLGPVTGDTRGVLGGGQVGCNYQFAPNWMIGFEGDGEAAKIKGDVSETVSLTNPVPVTVTGTANAQTDWIASATGRLGWTWDRVMLYAKGGAAWAGEKYSADLPAFNEHIATSVARPGWTAGGGVGPTYHCPGR
jgi:outer membrane immunogenic protein